MNEYLRDFINENVSTDCGGDKGLTSPETIQNKINEILNRLDRLEAGLGMTITLQDQLALTFFDMTGIVSDSIGGGPGGNGPYVTPAFPIPESGTITRVTAIGHLVESSVPGSKIFLQFATKRGSAITNFEVEASQRDGPFSVTMNVPVLGDDYFVYTGMRSSTAFAVMPCHAYLQLPARTYQVER